MTFPFEHSYARLPERFFRPAQPARVAAPRLIRFNAALARELGLSLDEVDADQLAQLFSGHTVPAGAFPLAMAYAGHQFGHYNPQLGDGRAILLGEVVDAQGRRRDIQLKGAGQTPFSRRGDGCAALGPVLREYLVSEAMFALGLPTTRALAAVLTGEPVYRETPQPGAVFTRVAASHIRVGTFQFFAAQGDDAAVKTLADYVIDRHYPELASLENPYRALLQAVTSRQAALVARWLSIGFIHGVMNTDNMTVSGETIDFGPCAFLDEYDPKKVFSYIDQGGRYAYGNQPGIAQWNLAQLAETLLRLFGGTEDENVAAAHEILVDYEQTFHDHWLTAMRAKFGLTGTAEGDLAFVREFLALMQRGEADFTLTFRTLGKVAGGAVAAETLTTLFGESTGLADWLTRWRVRLSRETLSPAERQAAMERVNPAVIPRNHRIEQVIQAALKDDFEPFERFLAALEHPYEEDPAFAAFQEPPKPEERIANTFCGT